MTECYMCLLGLIFLSPLLTGISGVDDIHVFSSSGENVRLPCNNALSDCTSTTWIYSKQSETVELIAGEEKKKDIERHERLSLGSDCSLNVMKVTKEDYGSYSCQQFVNGEKQGADARVYLHFLHVSSSSSQSEISPGSVTLFCQLYYYGVSCDTLVHYDGVKLIWVNQAGVNLQTDSRYQILFSSKHCNSSLTTTLLNEDHNREWRCLLTQRDEVKTSAAYTVKYSALFETTPVTSSKTAPTTNTPVTSTQLVFFSVIGTVAAAALAVLLTAVILWLIRKKRADKRGANDSVEQKDEVTYAEVATYCKVQDKKEKVNVDKVTYAVITVAAGPQENCSQLYATVNKNHHK